MASAPGGGETPPGQRWPSRVLGTPSVPTRHVVGDRLRASENDLKSLACAAACDWGVRSCVDGRKGLALMCAGARNRTLRCAHAVLGWGLEHQWRPPCFPGYSFAASLKCGNGCLSSCLNQMRFCQLRAILQKAFLYFSVDFLCRRVAAAEGDAA